MIKKKAASRIRLRVGAVFTAEQRKNSKPELYNRFLFCNSFLPFRRYLHSRGHEDMFFRQEDMKTFDITKHPKTSRLQSPACLSFLHTYYYTGHVALRRLG